MNRTEEFKGTRTVYIYEEPIQGYFRDLQEMRTKLTRLQLDRRLKLSYL